MIQDPRSWQHTRSSFSSYGICVVAEVNVDLRYLDHTKHQCQAVGLQRDKLVLVEKSLAP